MDLHEKPGEARVNPEMPIPPEVSAVHGITDEMVADAPTFKEAISYYL